MTEYFPEEKEEEDATFIVSSFNILSKSNNAEHGRVRRR